MHCINITHAMHVDIVQKYLMESVSKKFIYMSFDMPTKIVWYILQSLSV